MIIVFYPPLLAFGRGAAKAFQDNAEAFGVHVSIFETVPFQIALLGSHFSVRTSLENIKRIGSKVIFISAVALDASEILKEARTLGLVSGAYQWLSGDGWVFEGIGESYGHPEELLGVIGVTSYTETSTSEYQEFIEKFKAKQLLMFNRAKDTPEVTTVGYYDAMILFANAGK